MVRDDGASHHKRSGPFTTHKSLSRRRDDLRSRAGARGSLVVTSCRINDLAPSQLRDGTGDATNSEPGEGVTPAVSLTRAFYDQARNDGVSHQEWLL